MQTLCMSRICWTNSIGTIFLNTRNFERRMARFFKDFKLGGSIFIFGVLSFLSLSPACAITKEVDTLGVLASCDMESRKAELCAVTGDEAHISIPRFVFDEKGGSFEVRSINRFAFMNDGAILTLDLPSSINFIGTAWFSNCTNLVSVTIPDSINYVSLAAFRGCTSLKQLNVKSVSWVGKWAFGKCKSLQDLSFLNSVKAIDECAFNGCESIETVESPDCLTELGIGAFENCTKLRSVRFSKSIQVIRQNTFKNCLGLVGLFLPENIKEIRPWAFEGCSNLKVVKVSKSCKISDKTFPSDTKLEFY